jgi:hypothetical protein
MDGEGMKRVGASGRIFTVEKLAAALGVRVKVLL